MKYVKYFEAFNPDDFDPDAIASNLYQYSQEWQHDLWKPTLELINVTSDKPTYNQIVQGIEDLIDEAKGSKLQKFIRYYESLVKNGKLYISLEEVEDLFLDITDCTVTKSNKYDSNQVFNILVDIKNISESDLQYINNHIYGTVKNRLPGTLYIKRVTVLMEEDGKYDIKIRLFERPKSNPVKSKDDNMNWLVDALRGIRDGDRDEDEDEEDEHEEFTDEEDEYEEDDPDYEG